ncbi:MAG: alanine racemase [Candidatus Kapabacteria bacterium]|nr:alanine racemase [Candidatus Kapabacteria bacterium]
MGGRHGATRMRSTRVLIDLDALVWNLSVIRHRVGPRRILAMVKANAYGHGMVEVSRTLVAAGADMLGVALVDEAVQLRSAGITMPIMVLTPVEAAEAATVVELGLLTVACDLEQVRALAVAAEQRGTTAIVHVYVDTGMNREGVRPDQVSDFVRQIDAMAGVRATGILTHFSSADTPHDRYLAMQRDVFTNAVDQLAQQGRTFQDIHMANTAAVWNDQTTHGTIVRPGLSLYGYAAADDDVMTLRPVMSVVTSVLSKRRIRAGETVSYGRRWMAASDTTIVTIPIGYGDGYPRALSGKAQCIIRGRRYPVVGTICMDECMVDVGDDAVELGDEVVILGTQPAADGHLQSINATDIAVWANTIPYEVTTAFSARVPRQFINHPDDRGA